MASPNRRRRWAGARPSSIAQVLRRDADKSEEECDHQLLQGGGDIEPAIRGQLGSAEYRLLFGSDAAFVESLHSDLLHRNPTSAEVTGQVSSVQQLGRFAVAQNFLASNEYRSLKFAACMLRS